LKANQLSNCLILSSLKGSQREYRVVALNQNDDRWLFKKEKTMKTTVSKSIAITELFEPDRTLLWSKLCEKTYPWEILSDLHALILEMGGQLPLEEFEQIGADIWIAKDATVAESASLHGPLIIDHGAQIRHCAYIRGDVIVGKGCVVGNSTELKNTLLFDKAQAPHYNYVGDSILGYASHMGAGSIASNLKTDQTTVMIRAKLDGEEQVWNTGRRKVGAILGDHAEVGCGSVLNPGTVIGKNSNVYPMMCVRGVVPENAIMKSADIVVPKS
jgi:UDP-3-O-[3-hydroxymyristoyl] glucosamine N-acyltransferase